MSGVGATTTEVLHAPAWPRTASEHALSRGRIWSDRIPAIGVAVLGAALGLSQLVHGAYDESTWAPIALGALALVVVVAVAAPRRPPVLLSAPLIGLWLWSLVSASWSGSTDAAHIAANRWLLYAAAVVVLWAAFAEDRHRAWVLLSSVSIGVLGGGIWMLVHILDGAGQSLFLGTRLNNPLGYVNGQAAYLLIAAWPCLAWAEHRGSRASPAIAGAGMAGLVTLLGLGLLAQSRSWEVALAASVVILVAVVPGRRRRAAALLLAGAAIVVIYGPLADVWRHVSPVTGAVTADTTQSAAVAIIAAALGAGVVWAAAIFALRTVAPTGSRTRRRVRRFAAGLFLALGLAAAVVVGLAAGPIARQIHTQYKAFVRLEPRATSGSRLLSGAGNRYDYWRVSLIEFRSNPVIGVGAGNYDQGYYLHRRTIEPITQPHSLELQTLAELGLVGALLLCVFLITVATGLWRTARRAQRELLSRSIAVAAGGMFIAWLVQTSVDWMHLIPGLTAVALAAAVALALPSRARSRRLGRRARIAAATGATAIALVGALTIAPRVLSLRAQSSAESALADGAPRTAIADASDALRYDSRSVPALVLRSAGFARLDDFAASLSDLKRAAAIEPKTWTTWALIGDLQTRRGHLMRARAAYAHARALDPLEPALTRPATGTT